MASSHLRLLIHIFGQPTAGQQQALAHVVAYLLRLIAILAHALDGVPQHDSLAIARFMRVRAMHWPVLRPFAPQRLTTGGSTWRMRCGLPSRQWMALRA